MNEFDSIAPFYDKLSRWVFGGSMRQAQTYYLPVIPPGARVLILGGGTGWLLAELLSINPTCRVWYIEASEKMLAFSASKTKGFANEVIFIHGTENSIPGDIIFDAVITHFFFDLFSQQHCSKVIEKIRWSLHPDSRWLVCDFMNLTWWQGAMLSAMYWFFSLVSDLAVNSLPEWKVLMEKKGLTEANAQTFYGNFIRSAEFRMNN